MAIQTTYSNRMNSGFQLPQFMQQQQQALQQPKSSIALPQDYQMMTSYPAAARKPEKKEPSFVEKYLPGLHQTINTNPTLTAEQEELKGQLLDATSTNKPIQTDENGLPIAIGQVGGHNPTVQPNNDLALAGSKALVRTVQGNTDIQAQPQPPQQPPVQGTPDQEKLPQQPQTGGALSTATKETEATPQETADLINQGDQYRERYKGTDKYTRSAGDALLNYAIGYFANGGDIKKGLAMGLQAGANTFINKSMREGDEVTKQMRKLKFSNGQIQQYVESGKLAEKPAFLVAEQLAANRDYLKANTLAKVAKASGKSDKPMNESQSKAYSAWQKMQRAENNLNKNYEKDVGSDTWFDPGSAFNKVTNGAFSEKWRNRKDDKNLFLEGLLRKDSGATVRDEEFEMLDPIYFAQPGDSTKATQKKALNRQVAMTAMEVSSGQMTPEAGMRLSQILSQGDYVSAERATDANGNTILQLKSKSGNPDDDLNLVL